MSVSTKESSEGEYSGSRGGVRRRYSKTSEQNDSPSDTKPEEEEGQLSDKSGNGVDQDGQEEQSIQVRSETRLYIYQAYLIIQLFI